MFWAIASLSVLLSFSALCVIHLYALTAATSNRVLGSVTFSNLSLTSCLLRDRLGPPTRWRSFIQVPWTSAANSDLGDVSRSGTSDRSVFVSAQASSGHTTSNRVLVIRSFLGLPVIGTGWFTGDTETKGRTNASRRMTGEMRTRTRRERKPLPKTTMVKISKKGHWLKEEEDGHHDGSGTPNRRRQVFNPDCRIRLSDIEEEAAGEECSRGCDAAAVSNSERLWERKRWGERTHRRHRFGTSSCQCRCEGEEFETLFPCTTPGSLTEVLIGDGRANQDTRVAKTKTATRTVKRDLDAMSGSVLAYNSESLVQVHSTSNAAAARRSDLEDCQLVPRRQAGIYMRASDSADTMTKSGLPTRTRMSEGTRGLSGRGIVTRAMSVGW